MITASVVKNLLYFYTSVVALLPVLGKVGRKKILLDFFLCSKVKLDMYSR